MTKPKQERLPGMVPKHIAELEDAAEELKEHEGERLSAQELETKARKALTELMKKHSLTRYDLDEEREIVLEYAEEKAFVRKKKKLKQHGNAKKKKD